jgi:hypothetical protein
LKRLKKAMGSYWKKLAWIWVWRHVRLGLAPRPLGVGAASASDRRAIPTVNLIRAILALYGGGGAFKGGARKAKTFAARRVGAATGASWGD